MFDLWQPAIFICFARHLATLQLLIVGITGTGHANSVTRAAHVLLLLFKDLSQVKLERRLTILICTVSLIQPW